MVSLNLFLTIVISTLIFASEGSFLHTSSRNADGANLPCSAIPDDFPEDIPISFSKECTVYPRTAEDVVRLANWATLPREQSYRLIPGGSFYHRSRSFLDLDSKSNQLATDAVQSILVSTKEHLNSMNLKADSDEEDPGLHRGQTVTVEAGATLSNLLDYLGSHKLGFYAAPNEKELSIGGVLASTGGHGTGIPTIFPDDPLSASSPTDKSPGQTYGPLSNAIIYITIVGWNPTEKKYELVTVKRSDPDGQALLAHNLGHTFITSVTMRVGADQTLETTRQSVARDELFGNVNSISSLLDKYGRVTIVKEGRGIDDLNVITTTKASDIESRSTSDRLGESIIGPSREHFFFPIHSPNTDGGRSELSSNASRMIGFTVLTARKNLQSVSKLILTNFENFQTAEGEIVCDSGRKSHPALVLRFTGVDDASELTPNPSLSFARPVSGKMDYDKVIWVELFTFEFKPDCEIKLMKKLQDDVRELVEKSGEAVVRLGDFLGSEARAGDTELEGNYKAVLNTLTKYDPHGVFAA